MKVAIDISPIDTSSSSQHKVRGAGKYIEMLKENLTIYDKDNNYVFFSNEIPPIVDVVHYPYFEPFFLSLPYFEKTKTIVTVHDLIPLLFPKEFPSGIKGKIKWQIQRHALQRCDGVITDSECSKKDIIKLTGFTSSKIFVVPLAVSDAFRKINVTEKRENLTKKYNLPEEFVLYVGDATWNKNLPRLIDAIKQINIPLVMVGKALSSQEVSNNPWNKDLKEVLHSTENDKRFIKMGYVSEDDLVTLYNMASLLVMPSLYEGFGLPVLEAMSCECPVVTTREGSLPEVAGDAAYYVEATDITSIASGIGEVFFSKEIQKKLSSKSREQAQKFTVENMIKKTVEAYSSI